MEKIKATEIDEAVEFLGVTVMSEDEEDTVTGGIRDIDVDDLPSHE